MRKRPSGSVAAVSSSQLDGGSPSVSHVIGGRKAEIEKAGLEVEVRELSRSSRTAERREDGQAELGVEAVLLEVLLNQNLKHGVPSRA